MSAADTVTASVPLPTDLSAVDYADPMTYAVHDREELWDRLRREDPVHHQPAAGTSPGYWVVTGYDHVAAALKDSERLISERGNVFATLLRGGDAAGGRMIAVTDGPRHRSLRGVLLKAFTPRALAGVVERVRATTDGLVAAAVERGDCEVARDIADHVPMNTVCDLLGVPSADRSQLLRLTKSALSSEDADASEADARDARNEILLYFADLVDERRERPGEDVVSVLATSVVDGEAVDDDTIVLNCYSIILGGDDTSRLAMVGGVAALMEHPGQWRRLREGTVDVAQATEEVLRWTTPAMHFGRRAAVDTPIGDVTVSAGDVVTLWLASANRDPSAFGAPATFDLGRAPNRHLTFGLGPHFCLGAFLGRAEVAALLASLRERVEGVAPAGGRGSLYSNFLHGYSSLPVTLRPTARSQPVARR